MTTAAILDELRVADVIREMAAARPEAVAIRHGDRALTYGELDERSNRLAQALSAAGARRGSRIAHLDRSSPEVVELLAAVSKLGAVAVPLNWRLAAAELTRVVSDAAAPLMIAGPAFDGIAGTVADTVPHALEIVRFGDEYERWLESFEAVD